MWKDIRTSPIGKLILISRFVKNVSRPEYIYPSYNNSDGHWFLPYDADDYGIPFIDESDRMPTHWMEIPEPPKKTY